MILFEQCAYFCLCTIFLPAEQNINGTLHSVRSLKSTERNITKEFMIVQRKIKRYSSMVDNASADSEYSKSKAL